MFLPERYLNQRVLWTKTSYEWPGSVMVLDETWTDPVSALSRNKVLTHLSGFCRYRMGQAPIHFFVKPYYLWAKLLTGLRVFDFHHWAD